MYFGHDEKNTIWLIHILHHTGIQYFNTSMLVIRHTSKYLFHILPTDYDTSYFRVSQISKMTISIRHWQRQQPCTTVFLVTKFSPLQYDLLFHLRSTSFHHFRKTSNFDNSPPSTDFPYFAYNTRSPPFSEILIRIVWIAPN